MRLLLPLILLVGSPAFAADQFDLACDGTKWIKQGTSGEPYKFRAHVDLAAKKWCNGDCKTVQDIDTISTHEIILTEDRTFNAKVDSTREVIFDREEKTFKDHFMQNKPTPQYLGVQANCTLETFTPFASVASAATGSTGATTAVASAGSTPAK
jgi:hypothetical protein